MGAGAGWARVAWTIAALVIVAACADATGPHDEAAGAAPAATTSSTTTSAPSTTAAPPTTTTSVVDEATILLAWTSGGLPAGFAADAAERPEIERLVVVRGGQADLLASSGADGTPIDVAPEGWAYPLEAVAVPPEAFGGLTNDPADRALIAALRPGEALLTATSAELRRIGVGGTLHLRGLPVVVTGIVTDRSGAEAEVVLHTDDAIAAGVATERYVLAVHDPSRRAELDAALIDLAAPASLHLRTIADTTRLRHGDSVVPLVYVKAAFGEFAYRDLAGRAIEIDPAWIDANVVWARVPILGEVRCHRAMVEPLGRVLGQLESEGLAHVVDPAIFSGCWNARRIRPGMAVSKHSWGIAVDINIDGDPYGDVATQHPRLIELMEGTGFSWGGRWQVPDPGHYELDPEVGG